MTELDDAKRALADARAEAARLETELAHCKAKRTQAETRINELIASVEAALRGADNYKAIWNQACIQLEAAEARAEAAEAVLGPLRRVAEAANNARMTIRNTRWSYGSRVIEAAMFNLWEALDAFAALDAARARASTDEGK